METNIGDIAESFHGLSLAQTPFYQKEHEASDSTRSHLKTLHDTILALGRSVDTITYQTQIVQDQSRDAASSHRLSIEEVVSLHHQTKRLKEIVATLDATANTLAASTECFVIHQLRWLGTQCSEIATDGPLIRELLLHFEGVIKEIVREVLNTTHDQSIFWKVAEECYRQAVSWSGSLSIDEYFDEIHTEFPYDPDFESEEYYEHEDRIQRDESYAASFQIRAEQLSETRDEKEQGWIHFWTTVLSKAPQGPTLFLPPPSIEDYVSVEVPKYLFRTFDAYSSGINDDSVIASAASMAGDQNSFRSNFLALEEQVTGAQLIYNHSHKPLSGQGEKNDNFMSWTSSLAFAVQYAIYRAHTKGRPESDVKICAIDTTMFPPRQFVRDISLLKVYQKAAESIGDPVWDFFKFRLYNADFYNGEYLSQGIVNHAGRSCIVSLEHIKQAGLAELYPEFKEKQGKIRWSKRLVKLREEWSAEKNTTDQDINLALALSRDCFAPFDRCDIACLILALKNRKLAESKFTFLLVS
jgi:hypothetical protein